MLRGREDALHCRDVGAVSVSNGRKNAFTPRGASRPTDYHWNLGGHSNCYRGEVFHTESQEKDGSSQGSRRSKIVPGSMQEIPIWKMSHSLRTLPMCRLTNRPWSRMC